LHRGRLVGVARELMAKGRLLADRSGAMVRGFKRLDLATRDTHGGYSRNIVDCLQPVSRIAEMASILTR
jgi:hypothetical protein